VLRIVDYQGRSTIGLTSLPPENTPLSVVVSMVGSLASSSEREASVTEAHPKERETIAIRAKRDLRDFITVLIL